MKPEDIPQDIWDRAEALAMEWVLGDETRETTIAKAIMAAEKRGEDLVERAFRDGLAYGTNVSSADPDVAWEHSSIRAAIRNRGKP